MKIVIYFLREFSTTQYAGERQKFTESKTSEMVSFTRAFIHSSAYTN